MNQKLYLARQGYLVSIEGKVLIQIISEGKLGALGKYEVMVSLRLTV